MLETIKNGTCNKYVINLDEYADIGTKKKVIYFDSFGVEHGPKKIKTFIGQKNIKTNIFRIQADNSIMCGYFCIRFIDYMLVGKNLIDFTDLFSPYDLKNMIK